MESDLNDLKAFLAVARAKGFREGARAIGSSASVLSEAIRRLETQLGVRLFNRTTRSVVPTEAGQRLLERLEPALGEVQAALDVVNGFRDRPAGVLRLNVPVSAARLVLPEIVPAFLADYPDIRLEIFAEDSFVNVLAAGCDAGILCTSLDSACDSWSLLQASTTDGHSRAASVWFESEGILFFHQVKNCLERYLDSNR